MSFARRCTDLEIFRFDERTLPVKKSIFASAATLLLSVSAFAYWDGTGLYGTTEKNAVDYLEKLNKKGSFERVKIYTSIPDSVSRTVDSCTQNNFSLEMSAASTATMTPNTVAAAYEKFSSDGSTANTGWRAVNFIIVPATGNVAYEVDASNPQNCKASKITLGQVKTERKACTASGICLGDIVINISRENVRAKVVSVQGDGRFVLEFLDGALQGKTGNGWEAKDLARMNGCSDSLCVGDRVINTDRENATVEIAALQADGRYVLRFTEGSLAGKLGSNWEKKNLAVTKGCLNELFCVGTRAMNIERNNTRVEIVGIQENGKLVLKFLDGSLQGKLGSNWDVNSLAITMPN